MSNALENINALKEQSKALVTLSLNLLRLEALVEDAREEVEDTKNEIYKLMEITGGLGSSPTIVVVNNGSHWVVHLERGVAEPCIGVVRA